MSDKPKQTCGTRRGNGVGKGDGWGGPAKGPGHRFVKGEVIEGQGKAHTAPYVAAREERLAMLKDRIFRLALEAQREETQLAAATAYLNREEGMPVARQITADATVEQVLRIEIVDEHGDPAPAGSAATAASGIQH
jgi:hypothetical protein